MGPPMGHGPWAHGPMGPILDPVFRGNVPKVTEGCSKMSLSEFATGSAGSSGSSGSGGNGVRPGRTDPGFFTPGGRMTVVNKLPQIMHV